MIKRNKYKSSSREKTNRNKTINRNKSPQYNLNEVNQEELENPNDSLIKIKDEKIISNKGFRSNEQTKNSGGSNNNEVISNGNQKHNELISINEKLNDLLNEKALVKNKTYFRLKMTCLSCLKNRKL